MGPNDAQIVRVFSREPKGPIADVTLDPTKDAEIVLEAEAGATLHQNAGKYRVSLVVRDLSDGTGIPAFVTGVATAGEVQGSFTDANWPNLAASFPFVVSSATLQNHRGHMAQAWGSVLYGTNQPGATFAVGDPFQILP
ncbi:hypothetical protein [Streptomyces sp. CRN 30]|uniref:hypothetical protein n=1 Tax=Streptomyces sp. CRN 30 TaxID=3075613 RepID=UPI002A7EB9E9|nr:hypothetical protein [Streptomyces sp. CRN 30]